ncbi:putative trans-sialidase [Trypanosoma cruzi]|nr:putative trans-sialidase [Trypanosoma cruzi]
MDATRVVSCDLLRVTFLFGVSGVVVAVAEAHYKNPKESELYAGIAAKSMEVNGGTWANGTGMMFDYYDIKVDRLLSPTTIMADGETCALVGGYGESGAPWTKVAVDGYWSSRYARSTVFSEDDGKDKREFEWNQ